MIGFRTVIILTVLLALIFAVIGEKSKRQRRHDNIHFIHRPPCTRNPDLYQYYTPCPGTPIYTRTSTQTTSTSTTDDSSEESDESTSTTTTASTSTSTSATVDPSEEPTSLERAHWCHFPNGTYIPLNYAFLHTGCSLCQCTKSRAIRCQLLQCMPTYCLDNKMPVRKTGQCCTQCADDVATNASCFYNDVNFPHGSIIKTVENKMQCWCQLGHIECRNYIGSPFDALSMLTDGAAIYIIIMVLFVILIFGLLLCCSGTLAIYLYYKHYQRTIQQAYNQYINPGGWQPMDESEESVLNTNAEEEKRLEAEQYFYDESFEDFSPPPYGAHNDSYVSEPEEKKL
jgi:hypothetical protein